jgi:hypothetical protein
VVGKGFYGMNNVAKAMPRFPGHYQPHLPADLGFYDLPLPEARAAQAELAASYRIHGFCCYIAGSMGGDCSGGTHTDPGHAAGTTADIRPIGTPSMGK